MPRKSTVSAADAHTASAASPTVDGDASLTSAAIDVSSASKPHKTSTTKADKGDADNTGIDVSNKF
jgi:hypothetical protein